MSVRITIENSNGSMVVYEAPSCEMTVSRAVNMGYYEIGSEKKVFLPGRWSLELLAVDVVQTASKNLQLAPTKTEMESRDGEVRKVEQLCLDLF